MYLPCELEDLKKNSEIVYVKAPMNQDQDLFMFNQTNFPLTTPIDAPDDSTSLFFYNTNLILNTTLFGGKATNLQKLSQINDISLAPWFVISSQEFHQFLKQNGVIPLIEELNLLCEYPEKNSKSIASISQKIQSVIKEKSISHTFYIRLKNAYEKLQLLTNTSQPAFAIRSSGILEDSSQSSCAGLYDTVLNMRGLDHIINGIKSVWASSFNLRVVHERIRLNLNQLQYQMGVIVQEQIHSQSSGVISTLVLSNNYPGIQISGNYGVGESVVSGEVSVDGWILHPTRGYILEEVLGSKESCHLASAEEGIEKIGLSDEKKSQFALNKQNLSDLFIQAQKIKQHYKCDVDIEYAIDKNNHAFILQARPLVNIQSDIIHVIDPTDPSALNVLGKGHFSVPGVASGRLVFIESLEKLETGEIVLQPQDIALAYVTTNVWSQYLNNIKGLITREGSPSSHPILLSREKQIPCVIGITENFENLLTYSNQLVTIDGFNKCVYAGEVKTKAANQSDLLKQFEPIQIREWPDLSTSLPHLLHNKMAIESNGIFWRRTPTYPVVGFQRELNLLRFELVGKILKNENIHISSKLLDGYTCCELTPFADYVALFNGFDSTKALAFNQAHKNWIATFLALSQNAARSKQDWEDYINAYAHLRSYIWLGDALRSYAQRKAEELGVAMELPAFYFEECCQEIQSTIPEIDTDMHQELYDLALSFQTIPFFEDINVLKNNHSGLYLKLEEIGKKYRFEHRISLDSEIDLNIAYSRLKNEIIAITQGKAFLTNKTNNPKQIFLPEMDELKEWLYVGIWNRILQSDSHHIDARAKEIVRPQLLKLENLLIQHKFIKSTDSIFNYSITEIGNFIKEVHECSTSH